MADSKLTHQEPAIFLRFIWSWTQYCISAAKIHFFVETTKNFCHFLFNFYANLSLSELSTTLTLEKAIRALAHIGVIWKSMPKI